MPIHRSIKRRCRPYCRGPWEPVGKRDRYGRGNREFPMKQCEICGHKS